MLRNYSINKIQIVETERFSSISVFPVQDVEIIKSFDVIKEYSRLSEFLNKYDVALVYIMPSDFFLMAIVTDLERLYPIEFERPSGGNAIIRFLRIFLSYTKMQLGFYPDDHGLRRLIFLSVKNKEGVLLHGKSIFSFGSRRLPLFNIDVDVKRGEIMFVQELKPRHKWGDVPMPIF